MKGDPYIFCPVLTPAKDGQSLYSHNTHSKLGSNEYFSEIKKL